MNDEFFQIYKEDVRQSLKKLIKCEDKEKQVQLNYLHKWTSGRAFRFDVVELGRENKILKVYLVCSLDDYTCKLNSLLKQMQLYREITEADVFLAYKNYKGKLHVLSLAQLEKETKDKLKNAVSFSDFYSILSQEMSHHSVTGYKFFFRGQANNQYEAVPSIYRNHNIIIEDQIYHEAIRRLPAEFTEDMSTFDKLVKMQHYELPTRLLDITTNPLVALYFACLESKNEDKSEADGEVLMYRVPSKEIRFFDSDSVSILANLVKRPLGFEFAEERGHLVYDIQNDKPTFSEKYLKEEALHKVLCVLPKLNNDRIIKQNGAFFIFGMGEFKNEPASLPELPYIINIKAESKKEILDALELMGIHEASLFPETDKVLRQIKNEFCLDGRLTKEELAHEVLVGYTEKWKTPLYSALDNLDATPKSMNQ